MTRHDSGTDETTDRSASRTQTGARRADGETLYRRLDRRRFVLGTGAAAVASLAGCIGDDEADDGAADTDDDDADATDADAADPDDDTEGTDGEQEDGLEFGDDIETRPAELPVYAKWLADADEGLVMRADYAKLQQIDVYDGLEDDEEPDQEFEDLGEQFPHIDSIAEGFPAFAAWGPIFIFAFMGFAYPIVGDIEMLDDDEIGNPIFTGESLMLVGEAMVLEGTAHEDALEAREDVDVLETHGDYTIYGVMPELDFGFDDGFGEDEEDDEDDTFDESEAEPFAIGNGELVFPFVDEEDEGTGIDADEEVDNEAALEDLRRVLDTAQDGIDLPHDDFGWLLDHVGDGALVMGGYGAEVEEDDPEDEVGEDDEDLDDMFDIDQETFERFEEEIEEDARAILMVTDDTDTGRVTRSGFVFETEEGVPERALLAELLAGTADELNVFTEGRGIVVEAFWA